ncbi:MAG: hypothetical protein ACKOWG_04995, partial [Planctomycetia bacterium]
LHHRFLFHAIDTKGDAGTGVVEAAWKDYAANQFARVGRERFDYRVRRLHDGNDIAGSMRHQVGHDLRRP